MSEDIPFPVGELPHPARADLVLEQVLFALSDPARLAIVGQLVAGPVDMARCHLQDPSIAKSTKSHLMRVLREAGVIRNDPKGRGRTLSLRRDDLDSRFPGLLDAILSSAPPSDAPDFN
ncbi:transcriptional regulator [Cypionkella sp.]|uniref:ArsR/SmtB family transcription factor n=1 Tax=Cypionkella sp. TaxID=2811411 RepID=UPI002AB903D2|nr:transcriptional regulator [Cypionkella sp.]MDZ4395803.1 transcriptional regulator [Cypionkella sp.]